MRALRSQARMREVGSPSAVCRCGAGRSAGPPALLLGEEELSGCRDRRAENHSSRESHPCRCNLQRRYSACTFPPHSRPLRSAAHSLISICRPLRLSVKNWVKTHSASRDAKQLVACISAVPTQTDASILGIYAQQL